MSLLLLLRNSSVTPNLPTASYLDGSTPYHTGPTASKYYIRDVSGNGNHALVKTPTIRSVMNGTVSCSIGTFALTGDFEYEFWICYEGSLTTSNGVMCIGGGLSSSGSSYRNYLWYRPSTGVWTLASDGEVTKLTTTNTALEDNKWHKIKVTRASTTHKLFIDDVEVASNVATVATFTLRQILWTYSTGYSLHGQMCDLKITTGGVTYYFPLQDGPGSTNTNRDIAWVATDGTGGIIASALVNGTVSEIWSAMCPGYVKDWSIEYGGLIGSNGQFVIGKLSGGNAADGSAKTLAAGKLGNPFSSLDFNSNSLQTLMDRSIPREYKIGQNINGQVTPEETAFRRTSADGDDLISIYSSSLSGDDLTNIRTTTGETAQTTWTIAELPNDTADEYFAQITANSGVISSDNQDAVRNLLQGLYDDGLYSKVLALYLYHGNHLNAARLNAINPGTHPGSWAIVWVGSPTLNASGGITPSSGNYGKSIHPDGAGLSLRSGAGLGFYSTSDAASSEYTMGIETLFHLSPKQSGVSKLSVGGYEVTGTVQDLSGFHFGSREPNTNVQAAYRNGTQYLTNSGGSFPNLGYCITPELAIVGGRRGSVLSASTTPIRLSIFTTGLLSAEVATLNTLIQTYISELV